MSYTDLFKKYDDISIENKLNHFAKYVRGQALARFIAKYELFKRIINVQGSIIECGVHFGGGVLSWAKLSTAIEPFANNRKIIGFDTFTGFPRVTEEDKFSKNNPDLKDGGFSTNKMIFNEIFDCIREYENQRPFNYSEKVELIKGDACETIPNYIKENKHLLISLLYLDFDLYEPTKIAIENFLPRMSKGSIIALDELNDPKWVGETMALLNSININNYTLNKMQVYPSLSYIII